MSELFFNVAGGVFSNVLQLLAGCLLSMPVYYIFRGKRLKNSESTGIAATAVLSLCGLALPLGIYGVIPLISALLASGFGYVSVLPFLASNLVFNMLVPSGDPSFIWRTGYRQMVLAFAAGLLAGLIPWALKLKGASIFRTACLPEIKAGAGVLKTFINLADDSFRKLGIFLIIGTAADVLFHKYALTGAINAVYANPLTSSLPGFFASKNVSDPFFLLTFKLAYMLMNLANLSALAAVMKLKGLALYFGYFVLWAAILAIPAFI